MNVTTMKLAFSLLIYLVLGSSTISHGGNPPDWQIAVTPSSTNISLGEPVYFRVVIRYKGSGKMHLYGDSLAPLLSGFSIGTLEVVGTNGQWQAWRDGLRSYGWIRPQVLVSNSSVTSSYLVHFSTKDGYAFAQEGTKTFRFVGMAVSPDMTQKVELVSEAARITVGKAQIADAEAWRVLGTNGDFGLLIQAPSGLAATNGAVAGLEESLQRFPGSCYSAHLAFSLGRLHSASGKAGYPKARAALRRVATLTSDTNLIASASEELSRLEQYEQQARENDLMRRRLDPPRVLHDQAWWELEAAGYDLRAVTDPGLIRPGVTNSYHQLMGNLRRRLHAGGITPEEYDQRAAEVLRSSARAFGRPLPPEELKRRREQYEQEDKALRERASFYLDRKWEVIGALADDPPRRRQAEQVKQGLEAERYDLGAMEAHSIPFQRAYRDGTYDLWKAYQAGRLKGEEFDRQYADLYRRLVREHLKPLTPEQWKERKATRPAPTPVPADEK